MALTLHAVQQAFPKAFRGPHAQKHEALIKELAYRGVSGKLNGIRGGIVVLENPYKANFETTTVRNFYGLNEKGELICLKKKAVYHRKPSVDDRRGISCKWSYSPKTDEMEMSTSISLDGKLVKKNIAKERHVGNVPEHQFYWLPSNKTRLYEEYDFRRGTYNKIIKDSTGNRGIYGEHGRIIADEHGVTTGKIKDGSFAYNENLGGVVSVKKPKEDFRLSNFYTMLENVYNKGVQEAVKKHLHIIG